MLKILTSIVLAACVVRCAPDGVQTLQTMYEPTWSSLQKHESPQWLIDAKFGIYTHVSLQTIKNIKGNENKHKHELIDDFKLEKFDASEWAELFKRTAQSLQDRFPGTAAACCTGTAISQSSIPLIWDQVLI